jgi:hypothetical protein
MDYQELRNQMKSVLNNHPNLCDHGWRTRSMTDEEFQEERDKMLTNDALDQFKSACEWVRLMQPIRTIYPRPSSYGLKHTAERYMDTYITNGVFIAAALHYGYRYKLCHENSPNCSFNISKRTIKKYSTK